LFKDFYLLAEADTHKQRYLYVIGDKYPIKFFTSNRKLKGVMRDGKLWSTFQNLYSDRFSLVSQYYEYRKDRVHIVDVTRFIPDFAPILTKSNNLDISTEN
jgi:hypothetical protein